MINAGLGTFLPSEENSPNGEFRHKPTTSADLPVVEPGLSGSSPLRHLCSLAEQFGPCWIKPHGFKARP